VYFLQALLLGQQPAISALVHPAARRVRLHAMRLEAS
jgi:hypothetical protein